MKRDMKKKREELSRVLDTFKTERVNKNDCKKIIINIQDTNPRLVVDIIDEVRRYFDDQDEYRKNCDFGTYYIIYKREQRIKELLKKF